MVAGNETTTNLIANSVRYLTEDKITQEAVRQDPSLVPVFVEEMLRYYPPVQAIGRTAAEDVDIGGVRIAKGSTVISWVASANRDELKFDDPDSFKLDRKSNPHMSFGFGIHFASALPSPGLKRKSRSITCCGAHTWKGTALRSLKRFKVRLFSASAISPYNFHKNSAKKRTGCYKPVLSLLFKDL